MRSTNVLVVDDGKLVRWSIRQKLELAGHQVAEASTAAEALTLFQENLPDLVTLDVHLPNETGLKVLLEMTSLSPVTPIIMITAYGAVDDAVKALQIGAYDYLEKPVDFNRLLHSINNALESRSLRTVVERVTKQQKDTYAVDRIIGNSASMREMKALLEKVASSEVRTILVQGESGTGKDLVAKALHYQSSRGRQPFTVLNCAAIPEQLLENELFGHERGAFTDAKSLKKGLLELSDGGSIFFDEISEIPLNLQAKLLRVLEDQTFRRVGGVKDISIDLRVICASNKDLEQMAQVKEFRDDLFYRLSVIPISLPPLRERKEDIDLLVEHFIQDYNVRFRKSIKGLTAEARQILLDYHWPGNVRELKNAIERAMILEDEGDISANLLPLRISEFTPERSGLSLDNSFKMPPKGIDLYELEKELIRQALVLSRGNQTKASRLLAVTRDTLRYKMKKYSLRREREVGSE